MLSCVRPVVELEAAWVPASPDAIEVLIQRGTLVDSDGRGLRRTVVDGVQRAELLGDGLLIGTGPDGTPFLARLQGGRPYAWLLPERGWLVLGDDRPEARVLTTTPVPVVAVDGARVRIELPFEDADGGPLTTWVERTRLTTDRPGPSALLELRSRALFGTLGHADRRVVLLDHRGNPFARTHCGSIRWRTDASELLQARDGIELVGRPGPDVAPCPALAEPTALTDLPDGWIAATRPAEERAAFTRALFAPDEVLYSAEHGRCLRWTVGESPKDQVRVLSRRWEDATFRYTEELSLAPRGHGAVEYRRRPVPPTRKVPLPPGSIGTLGGDPILLCGPAPAAVVDWDDDEVRLVRVWSDGEPVWAWPAHLPEERLYRSLSACLDAVGGRLEAGVRTGGTGRCG